MPCQKGAGPRLAKETNMPGSAATEPQDRLGIERCVLIKLPS